VELFEKIAGCQVLTTGPAWQLVSDVAKVSRPSVYILASHSSNNVSVFKLKLLTALT